MHRREKSQDQQVGSTIEQLINHPKSKDRISTLAPYIAQIQRRKKLRELAKQSKKNLNETSFNSFRIKDKSYSTLQKDTIGMTKDTKSNYVVSRLVQQRINREQRTKSLQRIRDHQYSKTIDHRAGSQKAKNNNFFNELYVRVKSRAQKERPKDKKEHQTIQCTRARSEQAGTMNVRKLGYTNVIEVSPKKAQRKGNFRRNKFQVSSTQINKPERQLIPQTMLSDSRLEYDKKQSNVSINKEMDRLAFRQMKQYGKLRNKQFHRSVANSNQKYLSSDSYRPAKSRNDIQVIVNTAKNPSVHKASHSTADIPHSSPVENTNTHAYDFDFPIEENKGINQRQKQGSLAKGIQGIIRSQVEYWEDDDEC